jgi:hypothetical protein
MAAYRITLGAALVVALGCSNDRKDAHCTPDAPSAEDDPACIYAGGPGPAWTEDACPQVEGEVPGTCPTFDDVFERVFTSSTSGNCTAGGCHGTAPGSIGIYLPPDPESFYEELVDTTGTVGRPYVIPDDPSTPENEALDSYIVCNVSAEHGGGFPMPKPGGLTHPDDIALVRDWVLCGAKGP